MKLFSFKNFLKTTLFLFLILLIILLVSGVSYFVIDKVQKKNNLMDIEVYSPISSLIVEENSIKKKQV